MRIHQSPSGLKALVFGFTFALSELWVYHSGFANRFTPSLWRKLEGPFSLICFLAAAFFFLRFVYVDRKEKLSTALFCLTALALLLLGLFPLDPPANSAWRIEVHKSERRLAVFKDETLVKEFTVALGDPSGDKAVMSDLRTPVGEFRICDKGPSQFHKWMGLNYPKASDAWRGRRDGIITWAEFWYLRIENLNGRIPYGNSSLGGAIGIHGGGAGKDWTLGCIALENPDIDSFYNDVPLGSKVLVLP